MENNNSFDILNLIKSIKVYNFQEMKNQYVIEGDGFKAFQSYDSLICVMLSDCILLDPEYFDYSRTTSKYTKRFLNDDIFYEAKKARKKELTEFTVGYRCNIKFINLN